VTLLSFRFPGSEARDERDRVSIRRIGRSEIAHYPLAAGWCAKATRARRFDVVVEVLSRGIYFSPMFSAAPVLAVCHHLVGVNAFVQASWPVAAAQWLGECAIPRAYARAPWIAISPSTRDDLIARGIARERVRIVRVGGHQPTITPGRSGIASPPWSM
jgi:hypothetical protein